VGRLDLELFEAGAKVQVGAAGSRFEIERQVARLDIATRVEPLSESDARLAPRSARPDHASHVRLAPELDPLVAEVGTPDRRWGPVGPCGELDDLEGIIVPFPRESSLGQGVGLDAEQDAVERAAVEACDERGMIGRDEPRSIGSRRLPRPPPELNKGPFRRDGAPIEREPRLESRSGHGGGLKHEGPTTRRDEALRERDDPTAYLG
jgi:hypothetical protein